MSSNAATDIPYFTLNNGIKIPSVGMGCWMGELGGGPAVEEMCKNALKNGYRHFDTAFGYGNEEHVGKAIRESGIPRSEIFLTTKLTSIHHDRVSEAIGISLKNLGLDYVDLYLMHWPQAKVNDRFLGPEEKPTFIDTWKDMEELLQTGKVKSIGVSNFSIKTLNELLPHCTVIPVTNQVELHPCLPSFELKKFCEDKGILLTAYSPFGSSKRIFFDDSDFVRIAEDHKSTPAQVAIAWAVQRGTIAVPKSANIERMKTNISLITLSPEETKTIDDIHKKPGMHRSLFPYHSDESTVVGWTYEQLGWTMTKGGIVVESV